MNEALKKQIVTAVQPVFLSPLVDQLTGFGQVSAIAMIQHLFTSYRAIDRIALKGNAVKMMGPYDSAEPLSRLIDKLKKRRVFARAGSQTIVYAIMASKVITLLAETATFS